MVALFHAQGVRKTFGEFVAINDVDMMLEKGVLTSIIGPNGAGKTTLINLFTGKLPCDSGRLVFVGTDITGLTAHQHPSADDRRAEPAIAGIGASGARRQAVRAPGSRPGCAGRGGKPALRHRSR